MYYSTKHLGCIVKRNLQSEHNECTNSQSTTWRKRNHFLCHWPCILHIRLPKELTLWIHKLTHAGSRGEEIVTDHASCVKTYNIVNLPPAWAKVRKLSSTEKEENKFHVTIHTSWVRNEWQWTVTYILSIMNAQVHKVSEGREQPIWSSCHQSCVLVLKMPNL